MSRRLWVFLLCLNTFGMVAGFIQLCQDRDKLTAAGDGLCAIAVMSLLLVRNRLEKD